MNEKLKRIYDLYVSKGLIKNTDFDKFSKANPEQVKSLYELGTSKGLFKTTDFNTFSSVFTVSDSKKKEPTQLVQPAQQDTSVPSVPSGQPSPIGGAVAQGIEGVNAPTTVSQPKQSAPSGQDINLRARQFDEFMQSQFEEESTIDALAPQILTTPGRKKSVRTVATDILKSPMAGIVDSPMAGIIESPASRIKVSQTIDEGSAPKTFDLSPENFNQETDFVSSNAIAQAQEGVSVLNSEIEELNASREREIAEAKSQNADKSDIDFINSRYDKLLADKDVALKSSEKILSRMAPVAFGLSFEVLDEDDPLYIAQKKKEEQIQKITSKIDEGMMSLPEEAAVPMLQKIVSSVDDKYQLFEFEESGFGRDELLVKNKFTGDSIKIRLNAQSNPANPFSVANALFSNSEERAREEASMLRGFIELNAEFPEYSVISSEIKQLQENTEMPEFQKNMELRELYDQKRKLKSQMRNYASNDKYLSFAYSQMNEAATIDYDISTLNLQREKLESMADEYQQSIDFLKSGQYEAMSDEQKAEAMNGLQLSSQQLRQELQNYEEANVELQEKQEDLNEIAGKSYIVAETRGNVMSGAAKSFTDGLASPLAFIGRAAGEEEMTAEKIASELFYDGVVSEEYMSSEDRNMLEQALFGVTESIGAAVGGLALMPVVPSAGQFMGFYSMAYMGARDEMNSPEFSDVSDAEKILFSSIYGVTVGMLDKFGLSKSISKTPAGKAALKWVFRDAVKSVPKNASVDVFEKELKSSTRKALTKGLFDIGSASLAEGGTETLQEVADIGLKEIYNEIKDKELFDTPKDLNEAWDRVSQAFALGVIGGGMMNGTSQVMRTGRSDWSKPTMKAVEKTVMNPGINEAFKKHVEAQVASGEMTQETADQVMTNMEESEALFKSVPEQIKGDDRYTALILIAERKAIEEQIEGKERSLVTAETKRISEINQKLKEIGEKPVAEEKTEDTTTEEVKEPETVTEPTPISETVNINYEEGADVEYKVGDGFYSEEKFIEKLNNEEFMEQVRNGQVELNVQNPSQAVESLLLTPKPVQNEVQQTEKAEDQTEKVVAFDKNPNETPTLRDAINSTNGNLSRLSGKKNQETRRKIIEEVTGEKVPLSKAGINNLIEAVDSYLGVDTNKIRPRINDDMASWASNEKELTPTPVKVASQGSELTYEPSGKTITPTSGPNSRQRKFIINAEAETAEQAVKQIILSGIRIQEDVAKKELGLSPAEMQKRKTLFRSTAKGGGKRISIDDAIEVLRGQNPEFFEQMDDSEIRNMIIEMLLYNETSADLEQSLLKDFTVDGVIYDRVNDRQGAKTFAEEQRKAEELEKQSFEEEINRLNAEIAEMSDADLDADEQAFEQYIESLTDEEIEEQFGDYKSKVGTQESTEGTESAPLEDEQKAESQEGLEAESFESAVTKSSKSAIEWLADLEDKLDQFGKETLGMNIPVSVAKVAVKAAKVAAKGTNDISKIVDAGIEAVKSSDWYSNLKTDSKKSEAEESIRNFFKDPSSVVVEKDTPTSTAEKNPLIGPDGKKERLFPLQVDEDAEISDEIKEGLSEDARKYIPTSNEVTVAEANEIINQKGLEQSTKDVLNTKNNMTPRVRVALALELIKKYNEIGTSEAIGNAVELADSISKYATELGQAVQIFSLWNRITADGMLLAYQRSQSEARKNIKQQNSEFYKGLKSGYKSGNKKSGKKAAQKVFGKNTPKAKKAKTFGLSKSDIEKGKKDALARLKKATKGGNLTSGGINVEALEALTDYGFYLFADGVRTFAEWARKMKTDTGIKDASVLQDIWMNKKGENGKTLNDLSNISSIENVVSDFFAEDSDPVALSEKLQEAFDLDKDLADGLADELVSEFNKVVKSFRKSEINKKVTGRVSKKVREAIDAVVNSDNLSSSEIEQKIEEAFGIKSLTEEQINKIKELEEEREQRPEGFLKDEVTREMLSAFDKFKGIPSSDILWSLWYAGVLSGYETQMLNIGANSINIGMETFVTMIETSLRNRDTAVFGKSVSGLIKGIRQGADEFNQVLTKGFSPSKISKKLEIKDTLENVDFWGGKLNPASYYKYVGRFMQATDTASYMAAYGMRKQEAAMEYYKEQGLTGKELAEKVTEVTGSSKEAYNSAYNQAYEEISQIAQRENYSAKQKKRLIRMRATEIINEKLPEEVRLESEKFAAFATFNYNPQGILGTIAMSLSTLGQKKAMGWFRLIVPFTRVVANVLNQQIDYTPYGYLRAFGLNAGRGMKESTRAKDVRERNRKLIKATIGLIGMTAAYALAKSYEDDEDPWFAITGKGPSNFNKRNQLYSQGWKPYSVKIGDTWINYQYSPVGLAFSYIGNWMDGEKYEGLSESSNSGRLAHAMQSSASGVFDMSFLTGLGAFFDALSTAGDPEKTKEKLLKTVGRTGSSFLIPNLLKQVDKAYDPTIYDKRTVSAAILSEIPVVKRYSGLKPKINSFGQEVEKKGNRFTVKVEKDPVWMLMAKHSLFAPGLSPNTKLEGVLMTDEEFYDYAKISGELAYKEIIDEIEELEDDFNDMEQEEKKKVISSIFREARKEAKEIVYDKYRD